MTGIYCNLPELQPTNFPKNIILLCTFWWLTRNSNCSSAPQTISSSKSNVAPSRPTTKSFFKKKNSCPRRYIFSLKTTPHYGRKWSSWRRAMKNSTGSFKKWYKMPPFWNRKKKSWKSRLGLIKKNMRPSSKHLLLYRGNWRNRWLN